MKNISIFVATHKQDIVVPSNSFFKPIQVGAELSDVIFPNMLHDNVGDNISSKNPNYCELTAIYWAWKNCDSDYYGLFHYRRYFSFAKKQYPTITDKFIFEEVLEPSFLSDEITQKYALDEQTMRSVIEDADFIAPQAVLSPGNETVYAQYSISFGHHIEDLERVIYIIENDFPEYAHATRKYLNGILHYPCNMFIMKKEIFHEYCEWLFAVLQKFEQCRNIESYSSIDNRLYGYLAERLTGVFITFLIDKKYKAKFMQRVYFESLNESEHKELLEKKKIEKKNQTRHALRSGLHKVGRTGLNSARIAYNKFVRKQKNELNFEEHILEKSAYATKIQLNSVKDNGNLFFVVSGNVSICIPSDLNVPVNFKLESHDSNTTIVGDIKTYNKQIDKFDANRDYSKISFEFHFYLTNLEQDIILNAKINESLHSQVFTSQILKFKENYWRAASLNISKIDFYNEWFLERRVSKSELEFQRLEKFAVEPLYSIVVPIYKTPKKYLEAMLLSVTEQSYQNFELILINASPRETKLSSYLNEKVVEIKLDKNYGITENTNYGIDAAKGDFICFMDHDDLLELDTLYEYTKYLNQHPDTDMFYCDEDKILNDCFVDPYFKPDFNIDLLYGINYVCHFLCCRASIVKSVERPTSIYDGAQDANMTFRVYEKARHIAHIPKTLYHWRIHEQSTAKDPAQKSYTLESARLAIEHHMQRRGIDCEVVESFKVPRHYEVLYKLKKEPLVSIIILNKNSFELIKNCLDSIFLRSTYKNFEIVLVDNNSDDKELEKYYESLLKKNNVQILHYNDEFNFSAQCNLGVDYANGEYIILLNNDTEVITDNWIEKLLGPCMRDDVGIVGPKLLFADGTVQHGGILVHRSHPCHYNYGLGRFDPGYYNTAVLPMDVSGVTAACLMSTKDLYKKVGGFDTTFPTNFNDVDFCLKVRETGLNILYYPYVEMYHFESRTRENEEESLEGILKINKAYNLLRQRYPRYFAIGDPFYNPRFKNENCYFMI